MPVFNMPRPGRAGLTNRGSSFAQEQAKSANYNARPSQPVQPELGMRKKPGFSGAKPGFAGTMPTRPPQSVQPIGSSWGGQASVRPPIPVKPPFGGDQQITPIGGGFSGNADFGQRQYGMDANFNRMAQAIQPLIGGMAGGAQPPQSGYINAASGIGQSLIGGGQAPQTGALPWWYRNNRQQPPNQQMGSLGAALNQFYGGGSNSVMNPTFHML